MYKLKFFTYSTSESKFLRFGGRKILWKEKQKISKYLDKDKADYNLSSLKTGYKLELFGSWDYLKPQYDELKQFINHPEEISFKDYINIPVLNKVLKNDNVVKRTADKCYMFGLSIMDGFSFKRLAWIEDEKGEMVSN